MKRSVIVRIMVLLLAVLMTGCSSAELPAASAKDSTIPTQETQANVEPTEKVKPTTAEVTTLPTEEPTVPPTVPSTEPPATTPAEEQFVETGLTEQQKNSFSMLYHLAITAEEIRISKDNRLLLEDIYTSLLNDINPGAIDETTQDHLTNLRDVIKSYINITVKRDRLQYIYNQDKAAAIQSAVPDPLTVLSTSQSNSGKKISWIKLAASVVYTAIDSYNNYKTASDAADKEFLMSGWELDDEETATIQRNRERAFDYMVDMVQEYDLDGLLTLSEEAIEEFAEICAIESVHQKIRRLESEEKTYQLLGNYWLELAECYYETGEYEKCLECVDTYNALSTGIYRRDYNYVRILPKVIVAAQEVYTGEEYVSETAAFAEDILENTTTDEWSLRYFAAQVYLDLYAKTEDRTYLENAYNIAYDNVTILLEEQQKLNKIYLSDVKEETVEEPDYSYMTEEEKKIAEKEYKEEQKRVKAYNKALKETRKTELPALYEPLVLNCDLLFGLAEEMNISDKEKTQIEAILQTETNGIFLSKPVNERYSFTESSNQCHINFGKKEIVIPVDLLTSNSRIVVSVVDNGVTEIFDDFTVSKVDRKEDDIESFNTYVSSKEMKNYTWTADSKITVQIFNGEEYEPIIFHYKVKEYKDTWLFADKVVFEEA